MTSVAVAVVLILSVLQRNLALTSFSDLNWIIDLEAVKSLRQLDGPLVKSYFDRSNTYIQSSAKPSANQVPVGWSSTSDEHYTAFGACRGDNIGCRSFTSDLGLTMINPTRIPVILYDDEAWPKTPLNEQQHPCEYMKEFTSLAHSHEFISIMAPDQNLMQPGGMIQSNYPGNETENWQSYVRYGMAACAVRTGTDWYHIMSQPFESHWCCNPAGNAQGSESDFINFVQQAALQARATNPKVKITMGLSTNPRYNPTPQTLYRDSLNIRNIVDGIWMNTGPRFRPAMAVQYYELTSGLVPFYLGAAGRLSAAYPKGSTRSFSLSAADSSLTSVSARTFASGTVIPAGNYKFEPFTSGRAGRAAVTIEFGYCEPTGCTHRAPIINRDAWRESLPADDPGATGTFTTSSATTLPAGGPYSLYLVVRVTSPGDFNLEYNSGSTSTNIAIPRPSTVPAPRPKSSVFFPHADGRLDTRLPSGSEAARFNLATAGRTVTFFSSRTYPGGIVIPADGYELQYWSDGHRGSAVLSLQFGYCLAPHCSDAKLIVNGKENWSPVVIAGAKGGANPYGALTTRKPTTLPPGGSYELYWRAMVKIPAPFDLLYGSATAPTNFATPFVQRRRRTDEGLARFKLFPFWPTLVGR